MKWRLRSILGVIFCLVLASCSSSPTPAPPVTPPTSPQPAPQPPPPTQTPEPSLPNGAPVDPAALYVFSDQAQPTFLGCLSCGEYDVNSVHNPYGLYGSEYSISSIFNEFSLYGSSTSIWSACNEVTVTPPIVVTGQGGYVGRLTVNQTHPEIIRDLYGWLNNVVCA